MSDDPGLANSVSRRGVVDPRPEKPMVTREQYERAREVLDSLPPGVYVKCAKCRQWKREGVGVLFFVGNGEVLCEGCGDW